MNSKRAIREKYIALRRDLSDKRRREASLGATEKLLTILSGREKVLSFASKEEEINLWPLNERLAKEKRLLLPRMVSELKLAPFHVEDLECELVSHQRWNILEPDPTVCQECPPDRIDCVLVPGIAFDRGHGRLGYGKGIYDRFLSSLSCPLIGVGFKEQLLETPFLHERHDVLLTEIYLF